MLIRAFVQMDELTARHPLQGDVARLKRAEADLRRAAGGLLRPDSGGGEITASLPALPEGAPGAGASADKSRQARRMKARTALAGAFEARMGAFLSERERRQQRIEDQRRDELTVLDAIKEAERERLAREGIDAETRNSLRARAADVTAAQSGVVVADAQLDPAAGIFPPLLDRTELDAEIARLEAGINTFGVGNRARLELRRRLLEAKLERVRRDLAAIKRKGEVEADAAARLVAERREQEIEAELESLREDSETRFLARAQKEAQNNDLRKEALLAAQAEAERRHLVGGGGTGDAGGALRLAGLFSSGGMADPAGAERAANRVAKQRARLEQFIRADVADTVRDIAQQRNIEVLQVRPKQVLPANALDGRRDMTRQFIGWLQPGAAAAASAAAPNRADANEGNRTARPEPLRAAGG